MNIQMISLDDIPDKMFIDGYQLRYMAKAKVLDRSSRNRLKDKSRIIHVSPFVGCDTYITPQSLKQNFRYLNGSKINYMGWKAGNTYIIMRECEIPIKLIKVPAGCAVNVNGAVMNNKGRFDSNYIICNVDNNGNIDRASAKTVKSSIFRKTCMVSYNEAIRDALSGGRHSNKRFNMSRFAKNVNANAAEPVQHDTATRPVRSGMSSTPRTDAFTNLNRPSHANNTMVQNGGGSGYRVVAQILKDGQRVGFVISNSSGKLKDINLNTTKSLALQNKLDGIRYYKDKDYFSAVNGSLSNLPVKTL